MALIFCGCVALFDGNTTMKIALLLPLIASTAYAFTDLPSSGAPGNIAIGTHHSSSSATRLNLYASVEAAIADAQRICAEDPDSPECKVAWDIVEELEAADSHKGGVPSPVAISNEAEYGSLVSGFDILSEKTDRKLGELVALTDKLAEWDGTDPSVMRVGDLAYELREALAQAKASLYR